MAWTNSTGFPHDHDSSNSPPHLDYMNGKIIIISLIILVILTIVIITFHVYARLFWQGRGTSTSWYRNLHGLHEMTPTGGLDKAIVDSLPNFTYTVRPHHDGGDDNLSTEAGAGVVECAVCLNEFQDNDACRLLPKCNHSFHTQCIDVWFLSNTTCPVCRTSAQVLDSKNAHHGESSAACLLPCQDIGGHKETPNSSRLQLHQGTSNDVESPKFSSTACMLPQKDITNHVQRPSLSSLLGGEHEQGPGLHVRGMLRSRVDARYDTVGEEMHNIDSTHGLMHNYESGIYCNSERHPSHSGQELALFRRLRLPNWRRSVSDRFLNIRQCVQFPSNVHSHLSSHLNTDHWQVGGRSLPHIIIDVPTPQDSFRAP